MGADFPIGREDPARKMEQACFEFSGCLAVELSALLVLHVCKYFLAFLVDYFECVLAGRDFGYGIFEVFLF